MNKSLLRKTIRTQRKKLSSEQVRDASKKISEKIFHLPEFLNAKHIAFYMSHENEIDSADIMRYAQTNKKNCYLPVIKDENELFFYFIHSDTKFYKNKFGIDEPIIHNQKPISPAQLDLIFIPLVAFDESGNRVGRGAGFYDRALATIRTQHGNAKLIGLAYEFQRVENITADAWDVKMDMIITDNDLYQP